MLFLLRKLRKMELHKRSGRYFVYAVGEIMLIMVGILLALQIQNWNEGRKLEKERLELIEGLSEDFKGNLDRVEETLKEAENDIEQMEKFMVSVVADGNSFNEDDVSDYIRATFGGLTYSPLLARYNSAVSTGVLGLLDNPALEELLLEFVNTNSVFQLYHDTSVQDTFLHGIPNIRRKLGSMSRIHPTSNAPLRKLYPFSKEELLKTLKDKESHAAFENRWAMKNVRMNKLVDLKDITDEILAALEALE